MAFSPNHELPKQAIDWINSNEISVEKTNRRAWRTVGPGLLTRLYFSKMERYHYFTFLLFPPHTLQRIRISQHGKIYAYRNGGSTKQNYNTMNNNSLPIQFKNPNHKVSILISSLNTTIFIKNV